MAPTDWAPRGQKFRNIKVDADPIAQQMRAVFDVDPNTFQMGLDWNGEVDRLTLTPVWADQVTGIHEIKYGWQGQLPNGDQVNIIDLQDTKLPSVLDDYTDQGSKIVRWFPASAAFANCGNFWMAEELIIGGGRYWDLNLQPDMTGDPNTIQPDWCIGSPAIYHTRKRNNIVGGDQCFVGKVAHPPRPICAGWTDGPFKFKGAVKGFYNIINGKLCKLFPMGEIAQLAAVSDRLSVDATLGYTTEGANFHNTDHRAGTIGTMPEDGTVESLTIVTALDSAGSYYGLYDDNANSPGSLVANSGTGLVQSASLGTPRTYDYTGSGPSLTSGQLLWIGNSRSTLSGSSSLKYDFDSAEDGYTGLGGPYTSAQDPYPTGALLNQYKFSWYITYSTGPSTPVTSNTTLTPSYVKKGSTSALTADISGSETIADAEYYVDTDPGEGSATEMTLGAGTTDREASATVPTTALDLELHDVSARGYDATNGWGAVDTAEMTLVGADTLGEIKTALATESLGNNQAQATGVYTATKSGEADSVSFELTGITSPPTHVLCALYTGDGDANDTLVANSCIEVTDVVVGVNTAYFTTKPLLVAGQKYSILIAVSGGTVNLGYNTDNGSISRRFFGTFTATCPATSPIGAADSSNARETAAWINYTGEGGGGVGGSPLGIDIGTGL